MLRLRGGGKKRKKKQYTTPKKNKHKRKKEKLRVLKYYKVDDSGKVTRLRKECPVAGPGHFMANHKVRFLLKPTPVKIILSQIQSLKFLIHAFEKYWQKERLQMYLNI